MTPKKPIDRSTLPRKKRGTAAPRAPRQVVPPVDESADDMERRVIRISDLRKRADDLKATIDTEQTELLELMEANGASRLQATDPASGDVVQATVVKGEIVTTDDAALKKRVGAKVWSAISTLTLDKAKLESAIKTGDVSDVDLAAASTVRQRKPFLKITRK